MTVTGDKPELIPIRGTLGERELGVGSLAVSVTGTDLAVVTRDRTGLRRALTATGEATPLASGLSDLLRPQFTRYGELWAIGMQDGRQKMWLFTADQEIRNTDEQIEQPGTVVDAPVLKQGDVTAFRISPDGSRMALVRQTGNRSQLGLARVIRGEKVIVDGWRSINLTQAGGPQVTQIADIAWLDANELLLLGATAKDAAMAPVRVTADASRITAEGGEPLNWEARQITMLRRPQTTIVVGHDKKTWRYDGSQWLPFIDNIDAIAYPG